MVTSPQTIGILLFDGVEELDAVGPFEVLACWTRRHPEDGYALAAFSRDGAAVRGANGLVLGGGAPGPPGGRLAVLVHPGGQGARRLMHDEEHLCFLRAQRQRSDILASICTGSLVLVAAGLLAGRSATTHWSALALLAASDPTIMVDESARYVDDGDVVTSSGISAGIDLALHLVDRLAGAERAGEVALQLQYDPAPTAAAASASRSPRRNSAPS